VQDSGSLTQFPDRSRKLQHALCNDARGGLFGRQVVVRGPGLVAGTNSRGALIRLSREIDGYSSNPEALVVSVDTDVPEASGVLVPVAPVEMFLLVTWQTGQGTQRAEIDLLANGTSFALAAGDGLQVEVIRLGAATASQTPVTVRGTVGFASGGIQATPQRTITTGALPMGTPIPIPKFAYQVRVMPDVLGALGAPGGSLVWWDSPLAVAPIGSVGAPVDGNAARIPNGAQFFNVTGVAGATVRAIFDLQLL